MGITPNSSIIAVVAAIAGSWQPLPYVDTHKAELLFRHKMLMVVCNISTDTLYRGGYVTRQGQSSKPECFARSLGESWVFTLDRLDRILATVASGGALLLGRPVPALSGVAVVALGALVYGTLEKLACAAPRLGARARNT